MIVLHCRPAGEGPSEIRIGNGVRRHLAAAGDRRGFALLDAGAPLLTEAVPAGWAQRAVAGGEAIKTLATAAEVLGDLARAGIDRTGILAALGGGTIGDLGGLCASLYLRGIELWMVPTTLLAMVDSSVGGKNAVNLPAGKNLVGTVHPPRLVLIDPDFLPTLPDGEFRSGLGEVLKVALGLDPELFAFLEDEREAVLARQPAALAHAVERCVRAKIAVVEADLRESGPRRLLNLGHTLGHALEAHAGFGTPHGLCVARGLHFALRLGRSLDTIPPAAAGRAHALLRAYGFAETPLPPAAALLPFLARDKKVEGTAVHFVLPTGIGRSSTRALPLDDLAAALADDLRNQPAD